ncbi:MAG: hypothetical protein O7H40_15125, partial [Gammaproteobacteria bacterium]|nr:hypothetical protein [Gammaproteobacteria bacterium]
REFMVTMDNRQEFERQSRLGVWENMLYNGAQMVAFGSWAFGGPGDAVVTHSVYADFDHWTATRAWGAYTTDSNRIEETGAIRAIFAGRNRLIEHSRATIIDYDSEVSEPTPFYRNDGDSLAVRAPSFGRQSIVAETRYRLKPGAGDDFRKVSIDTVWPALRAEDARMLLYGSDPLADVDEVIVMSAYRSISHWHQLAAMRRKDGSPLGAHRALVTGEITRLLMVQTDFGEPV